MRGGAFLNGKEGRVGFRTKAQALLADQNLGGAIAEPTTSLALLERARAWKWVKDPPAGEGQVGQIQHCRAVFLFFPEVSFPRTLTLLHHDILSKEEYDT